VVPTERGQRYYREVTAAFGRIKVATVDLTGDGKSDRLRRRPPGTGRGLPHGEEGPAEDRHLQGLAQDLLCDGAT
jgi:hypothetical protein